MDVASRLLDLQYQVRKAWSDAAREASLEARRAHAKHDDGKGKDVRSADNSKGKSMDKAREFAKRGYTEPLTKQENAALHAYATTGRPVPNYFEINSALRYDRTGELSPNQARIMRNMDSAFAKASIAEDTTGYRGINGSEWKTFAKMKPGQVFTDKGYASTSLRQNVAGHFTEGAQKSGGMLEVRISKGAKAISMVHHGVQANEAEVLLNRGSKFKVLSNSGNKLVVKHLG